MIRKMASSPTAEDVIKSLRTVIDNIQKAVERRPSVKYIALKIHACLFIYILAIKLYDSTCG